MKWMRRIALLLVAITSWQQFALAQASPNRVAIFVGPQIRDGFVDVDSGTISSIKEVQNEIRRSKLFSLVTAAADATIVLIVVGRGVPGSAGAIGFAIPGVPGSVLTSSIDKHAITTILRVGDYEKQLVSIDESGGGWILAARQVVKDVTAWTDANRVTLKH